MLDWVIFKSCKYSPKKYKTTYETETDDTYYIFSKQKGSETGMSLILHCMEKHIQLIIKPAEKPR